jgi:hypothetical protein
LENFENEGNIFNLDQTLEFCNVPQIVNNSINFNDDNKIFNGSNMSITEFISIIFMFKMKYSSKIDNAILFDIIKFIEQVCKPFNFNLTLNSSTNPTRAIENLSEEFFDSKYYTQVDYCSKKHVSFVNEYANDIFCPRSSCKEHRYSKCNVENCSMMRYEDCNHSLKYRVSNNKAFYIPCNFFIY